MRPIEKIYSESADNVRPPVADADAATLLYGPYVSFVTAQAQPGDILLDVGCGNGWTTRLFSQSGLKATGIDLHCNFSLDGDYVTGNVLALPFVDNSFDVVTSHEVLEHTTDPQLAIDEMLRVIRPGGLFVLVGPNLLSPLVSAMAAVNHVWRVKPLRRALRRDAKMPRHPFGNTIWEVLGVALKNMGLITRKSLSSNPSFNMREPDLRPPFHSDNDASYLCNPIDLTKYLYHQGCEMVLSKKPNWPLPAILGGGTWIVARKA